MAHVPSRMVHVASIVLDCSLKGGCYESNTSKPAGSKIHHSKG